MARIYDNPPLFAQSIIFVDEEILIRSALLLIEVINCDENMQQQLRNGPLIKKICSSIKKVCKGCFFEYFVSLIVKI